MNRQMNEWVVLTSSLPPVSFRNGPTLEDFGGTGEELVLSN